MTATAERAASGSAPRRSAEMVCDMLSATFDVICEVALSGREHFDAKAYGAAITRYFLTAGRASLLDFLEVPPWIPRPGSARPRRGAHHAPHGRPRRSRARRRREGARPRRRPARLHHAEGRGPGDRTAHDTERPSAQHAVLHRRRPRDHGAGAVLVAVPARHRIPQVQARARDEARRQRSASAGSAADLEATPYVEQVMQEAMRLIRRSACWRATCGADTLATARSASRRAVPPIYALHRHRVVGHRRTPSPGHFSQTPWTPRPLPLPALRRRSAHLRRRELRDDAGAHHPDDPARALPLRAGPAASHPDHGHDLRPDAVVRWR